MRTETFHTLPAGVNRNMAVFLLVHGGGHGRWCWHKIIPKLEAAGHTVRAVDLTAHGQESTPPNETTLEDYIQSVRGAVYDIEEQAVLVGHSLSGMVVSATAEKYPDYFEHLVYLTAYIVPSNQSLAGFLAENDQQSSLQKKKRTVDEALGASMVADEELEEYFYNECSEEDIALAKLLTNPSPIKPKEEPIITCEKNYGRIPKTYIKCEHDKAIPLYLQTKMLNETNGMDVYTLDADHSAFFSAPDTLTEILLETAA